MKNMMCDTNCKYQKQGICDLYNTKLKYIDTPDPYDSGVVRSWQKSNSCIEKEVDYMIDSKIMEIYSFYSSFLEEMNMLFDQVSKLIDKRKSIYGDDNEQKNTDM